MGGIQSLLLLIYWMIWKPTKWMHNNMDDIYSLLLGLS
jgi:hypothetical protein